MKGVSIDEQKIKQVEDKLDGKEPSHAFTMEVTSRRVGGPDPSVTLEELEKNADIARARYLYASREQRHWTAETNLRGKDFEEALVTYYAKKHELRDSDFEDRWDHDSRGLLKRVERHDYNFPATGEHITIKEDDLKTGDK